MVVEGGGGGWVIGATPRVITIPPPCGGMGVPPPWRKPLAGEDLSCPAPCGQIFARGSPIGGNLCPVLGPIFARGTHLGGMACGKGSLFCPTLRGGARLWSVFISPGKPNFFRGSSPGRKSFPGCSPNFARGPPIRRMLCGGGVHVGRIPA